ncbi:MarR family winged helix-turn-helix transcriptional regulator [Streptomyces melanosporofaciens]|uniref:MarR family winged helix-turn-helix transcriptional regulator n=1 Tax=Streptomyces melanosporofaciens TaxID=67327 RepID=UPI00115F9B53|nr:helix-turn-helix transcriptional regulator [Streptomyces melanosporofaciens]
MDETDAVRHPHQQRPPGDRDQRHHRRLQRDGLISRTRDTHDGRRQVLEITQAGREALAHDLAQRDAWLDIALADLNETERRSCCSPPA